MALTLTGLGLTMVFSASGVIAEKFHGDAYLFFRKQFLFALAGIGVMAAVALAPRRLFYRMKYVWLGGVVLLLILTQIPPLGVTVNGASRWIRFGFFNMQPMELAKVALIIYLAWFFSQKQPLIKRFSVGFIPPFAVTGLLCGLLLAQPDFGGAAFLCMLLFLMCLVGGTRLVYLFSAMAMAAGAAYLLIVNSPYRQARLTAFLDPFKDAYGAGYQLVQSQLALGSGGIFGVGLGESKQKLLFLPEAHNDFIMAVVGEELGFVGMSFFFCLMAAFIGRAFHVAYRSEDLQDRFTALGALLVIALGAMLNMAVVLGAAPPKGVAMPFMSYGGSSLLACFICTGLLLNMTRREGKA